MGGATIGVEGDMTPHNSEVWGQEYKKSEFILM
jgi:hypothetical protein